MTSSPLSRFAKLLLGSTLALATAQACGPDFYADTFVRAARPDLPKQFVRGKLGLLQPSFPRADLFVAYRYLNSGTLDSAEQAAWSPTYPLSEQEAGGQTPFSGEASPVRTAAQDWSAARKMYPDAPATEAGQQNSFQVHTPGGYEYTGSYLNCADDAFRTATATLAARAQVWGSTSPYLRNWLHAQDEVFSDCSGPAAAVPLPAPAGSPALLLADRAYQRAAAHFYTRAFPDAAREFAAIADDRSSPWQPLGGYLAARALVREAFLAKPDAQAPANYDAALLQAAAQQLRTYLASQPAPPWRTAAQKQLALIRIRIDPQQRTRELAALVSGPEHDPNYAQDLQDLLWITAAKTPGGLRAQAELDRSVPSPADPQGVRPITETEAEEAAAQMRQSSFLATASERSLAPIVDWTLTFQSLSPDAPQHALERWRSTHAMPWLMAALALAPDTAEAPADLLAAAASAPASSPASETVAYHHARLLAAAGHLDAARAALGAFAAQLAALPEGAREPSTVNAVRGLQMRFAPSAAAFFVFAPRTTLAFSSEEYSSLGECHEALKNPARHYNCAPDVDGQQLDADAAAIFNGQAPLGFWLSAATSTSLSPQLRAAIAEDGWARATLLGDRTSGAALLALLPLSLREQATAGDSQLAPWMTLARNPGLRPYLNAGTQRSYSYDFVESFRDNWCYAPDKPTQIPAGASLPPAFLTPAERSDGTEQARRLAPLRSLDVGRAILREVEANPDQPQAPEALFLVLRMIRYGCVSAEAPPGVVAFTPSQESLDLYRLKRDAARLLREHYAASPWTRKAAPFVG